MSFIAQYFKSSIARYFKSLTDGIRSWTVGVRGWLADWFPTLRFYFLTRRESTFKLLEDGDRRTDLESNQEPADRSQYNNLFADDYDFLASGSSAFVLLSPEGTAVVKIPFRWGDVEHRLKCFAIEGRIYERLGAHPRLVPCHSWNAKDSVLTLEYMPNGQLEKYLESHPDIALDQRMRWAQEAAEAVEVLHSANIIHCDVKPRNFVVDNELSLRIIDFAGSSVDGSEALIGNDMAAFPFGGLDTDETNVLLDTFALGSVIYTLMTGHEPHKDLSDLEIEKLHASHQFPSTDGISCGDVIQGCWNLSLATARDIAHAIALLRLQHGEEQ